MEKPAKVDWSRPAKNDLLDIFEAMEAIVGPDRADALVGRIVAKSQYLEKFPEMGAIHHDVSSRYVKFRYLLEGHYRIVYTFDAAKALVSIWGVEDARRDPDRLRTP